MSSAAKHLLAARYYELASFAIFVYDIFVTLDQEVERIWKQKLTVLTPLWITIRWMFLLALIPSIISFHDTSFPKKICERFFKYPGVVAAIQRVVIGLVFTFRTYCIYDRSKKVAGVVFLFILGELFCKLYSIIAWGVPLSSSSQAKDVPCVLTAGQENVHRFIINWVSELVTDGIVLLLTLYRTYTIFLSTRARLNNLWLVIMRDGVMYFFIMFIANLTTVIMYMSVTADIKAINATFSIIISSILTARLILNLKSASIGNVSSIIRHTSFSAAITTIDDTMLENIRNDLGSFGSIDISVSQNQHACPPLMSLRNKRLSYDLQGWKYDMGEKEEG